MQKRIVLCSLVIVLNFASVITNGTKVSDTKRPKLPASREDHPARSAQQISTVITNDGPTILGSKTLFDVTITTSLDEEFAYQWGTYIPYKWKTLYSRKKNVTLEIDWWMSSGSKTATFFVSIIQSSGTWKRIAQNKSSVNVIDYLSINLVLNQDSQLVSNNKLHLGSATLTAKIHDPSNFFLGSIVHYTWIFNDGSPTQLTTWGNVDHVFKKEGLFLIQVSANLRKNGKLYSGKQSLYVTLKAKINGFILAWRTDECHPTLPSKEKSVPVGPVNFQFKLQDPFGAFTGATLSYTWNFGDGTIVDGFANITHEYKSIGHMNIVVGVLAKNNGNNYHGYIYKSISVRAPIEDLNVKGHPRPKKGTTVQFNITCTGSSPVSFCWYVARGDCKLPSDVICSPTRLYHHCRNTINHTFQHTGDYCVNVTATNTVSFAQKSIKVQVDGDDTSNKKRKRSGAIAAAILPILAGLLLLVAIFLGVKYRMQYQKQLARKSETATFDFRSSHISLKRRKSTFIAPCPFTLDCRCLSTNEVDVDDDHEMDERRTIVDDDAGPTTPKRKISYYGTIHRTLGQEQVPNLHFEVTEEEISPWTPRKVLSKSV